MYVFDIDGTIADCRHRIHHIKGIDEPDWEAFDADGPNDTPIPEVIQILTALHACGHRILLATGRNERGREYTEEWLAKHTVPYDWLLMRPEHDHRPDTVVKKEVLDEWLREQERHPNDVLAIFEDRARVVDMWRTAGYRVLQVEPGNY